MAPIRYDGLDLDDIMQSLPTVRSTLPMRYLGLPLSVRRLKKIQFQHLEDQVAGKLPPWQGKDCTTAGRNALVKSFLAASRIYHITTLVIPVEVLQAIHKIRGAFIWAGSDKISGGKCKINWKSVCRSMNLGGLRILHLAKFARALRLRWPWLEWIAAERTWVGTGNPCDEEDMDLFHALTKVEVGGGSKPSF